MDDSTRIRGYLKELIDCDSQECWLEDDGARFVFTILRLDREITFRVGMSAPVEDDGIDDTLSIVSDASTLLVDDGRNARQFEIDYQSTECKDWILHMITRGWLA